MLIEVKIRISNFECCSCHRQFALDDKNKQYIVASRIDSEEVYCAVCALQMLKEGKMQFLSDPEEYHPILDDSNWQPNMKMKSKSGKFGLYVLLVGSAAFLLMR